MDWPILKGNKGGRIKVMAFVHVNKDGCLNPVPYYRAYQPLQMMDRYDRQFSVRVLNQDQVRSIIYMSPKRADSLLGDADIFVISRLYRTEGMNGFLDAIHERDGVAVFDTDDDLTESFRELDGKGDEFIDMVRSADMVTVSTPHLSDRMAEYTGSKPVVLPNHVDVDWFARESMAQRRDLRGLTVGFVGTSSHEGDWMYPVEALVKISEENPAVNIVCAGFVPTYLKRDQVTGVAPVPYSRYPRLVRQFDIVCCSLDPDDGFNQSKSAIKSLESMASARKLSNGRIGGAVPVCTDMPVYRRAVNGKNGILVKNDEWYDALSMLVEDSVLRENMAYEGHKWVRKYRDARVGYRLWARVYKNLFGRRQ